MAGYGATGDVSEIIFKRWFMIRVAKMDPS